MIVTLTQTANKWKPSLRIAAVSSPITISLLRPFLACGQMSSTSIRYAIGQFLSCDNTIITCRRIGAGHSNIKKMADASEVDTTTLTPTDFSATLSATLDSSRSHSSSRYHLDVTR